MIALLIGLAGAGDLASFVRADIDHDGFHIGGGSTSVLTPTLYLFTGLTWQDGLDPLTNGAGIGRPHGDLGLVAEIGALHLFGTLGGGWDGWASAPLVVTRAQAVVELPPLPLLIDHRAQLESTLGEGSTFEMRTLLLYRAVDPLAVGLQIEPAWTPEVERRMGLGLRANAHAGDVDLGLYAGWDLARAQPALRVTAVVPF